MKPQPFLILLVLCVLLVSCSNQHGSINSDLQLDYGNDTTYTREEIDTAANVIFSNFKERYPGCNLNSLRYCSDQTAWVQERYGNSDYRGMEFQGSFTTDNSGCDGTLSPNETYDSWRWIMIQIDEDEWYVLTSGVS